MPHKQLNKDADLCAAKLAPVSLSGVWNRSGVYELSPIQTLATSKMNIKTILFIKANMNNKSQSWANWSTVASAVFALVALILSILSYIKSLEAINITNEANKLALEANKIAQESAFRNRGIIPAIIYV